VVFFGDCLENRDILLRQKAELAEQSKKQTELQTALMLSQIQPHFLYTAISAIRYLCKTNPADAYTSLGQFADYLRGNMDALGNGRVIPFSKEMEHIKTYLSLEQLRFGEDLQVEYRIEYEDFSLPALTVQPIVENAVRHGATMNEQGGKIVIATRKAPDGAIVTVTDNGPGFDSDVLPADGKSHFGLNNVRNCLKVNDYGELSVSATPGGGATVSILIKSKS
ncbi:MAG: histidine kinase, partial [Clostridia bacterium]|nr:histidine kinase [Clostridia bacterium]